MTKKVMDANGVGPQPGTPALILAPMEGVTDAPMREVQCSSGAFRYCVSEFIRVSHEVLPPKVLLRHVPELRQGAKTGSGTPVHIQLLGGDPERMAQAAETSYRLGAAAIDINFGCPAPTVNRHDGGATLLKYPQRIEAIVAAVRAALPASVPVSAKLRLGWDSPDPIFENAERAARGGASWITIHGRTRMDGYRPPAYWKPIGEVRRRLSIPVIANGDIWTLDDFYRCRKESGCEHFMLGRGALADPSLAARIARELNLIPEIAREFVNNGTAARDWLPVLRRFGEVASAMGFPSFHTARRIKQWVKMSSARREISWFEKIKSLQTCEEIFSCLENYPSSTL